MSARRKTSETLVEVETPVEERETVKAEPVKPKIYTTTAPLNLRSEAAKMTNDAILCIIPQGTKIVGLPGVKEINGTIWFEIRYGKTTGWVNSNFVK